MESRIKPISLPELAELYKDLLDDVLFYSVDAGPYPDGPCLEKWLRDDIKKALSTQGSEVHAQQAATDTQEKP